MKVDRQQILSLLREVVVVMMVVWILNPCMIGKESSHCVPISTALRQNTCSLLGYDVCDEPFK